MIKRFLNSNNKSQVDTSLPEVGASAPDFALTSGTGDSIELSDFRGRPVVLVFYPADKSSVCSSQLALYNEASRLFEEYDAQILGVSVDDQRSHQEFSEQLNLGFPLLSDDDPAGATARAYGVFDEKDGVADRALFVLDRHGNISWRYVAPRGVNPGAHGILEALETIDDKR